MRTSDESGFFDLDSGSAEFDLDDGGLMIDFDLLDLKWRFN